MSLFSATRRKFDNFPLRASLFCAQKRIEERFPLATGKTRKNRKKRAYSIFDWQKKKKLEKYPPSSCKFNFETLKLNSKFERFSEKGNFKKYKLQTNIGKTKNNNRKNKDRDYFTTLFKFVIYSEQFASSPVRNSSSVDCVFWGPSLDEVCIFAWALSLFFFSIRWPSPGGYFFVERKFLDSEKFSGLRFFRFKNDLNLKTHFQKKWMFEENIWASAKIRHLQRTCLIVQT